jgi:hypothetical protein
MGSEARRKAFSVACAGRSARRRLLGLLDAGLGVTGPPAAGSSSSAGGNADLMRALSDRTWSGSPARRSARAVALLVFGDRAVVFRSALRLLMTDLRLWNPTTGEKRPSRVQGDERPVGLLLRPNRLLVQERARRVGYRALPDEQGDEGRRERRTARPSVAGYAPAGRRLVAERRAQRACISGCSSRAPPGASQGVHRRKGMLAPDG